jgi:hypothetical protein
MRPLLLLASIAAVSAQPAVTFLRDVAPILNKTGCTSGPCHGAAKGKNGFKLSLRGYDPQFMTFPTVEDGPVEEEDELWPHVVATFGPRLHEAIPLLTRAQQEVVGMLLAGRSRSEVGRIRGTKRQVTHKILHAALRALTRELGPLPASMQARRSSHLG